MFPPFNQAFIDRFQPPPADESAACSSVARPNIGTDGSWCSPTTIETIDEHLGAEFCARNPERLRPTRDDAVIEDGEILSPIQPTYNPHFPVFSRQEVGILPLTCETLRRGAQPRAPIFQNPFRNDDGWPEELQVESMAGRRWSELGRTGQLRMTGGNKPLGVNVAEITTIRDSLTRVMGHQDCGHTRTNGNEDSSTAR